MKRRTFFIFLIPFVLCLVGTYFLLTLTRQSGGNQKVQVVTTNQQNFLVIRVDSLESSTPNLVSVWLVLLKPSEPSFVMFKRLYQAGAANQSATDISSTFGLSRTGLPSDGFLKALASFRLPWNSYFVIDSTSLGGLYSSYTGQELNADQLSTSDDAAMLKICETLGASSHPSEGKVVWNDLIPAHMRTDLGFETFSTLWETLTHASVAPHCEVLNLPSQ